MAARPVVMHDQQFAAMGTSVRIISDGTAAAVERAVERVHDLERRWSRFLPTSEISATNDHAGHPTIVSPETFDLVDRACLAWQVTEGRFDPTLLLELTALGYDRDRTLLEPVHDVAASPTTPRNGPRDRTSRCGEIVLEPALRAVTLPPGVGFDPGGIGKGLAADLIATDLAEAGASWVVVNLGGDMRLAGDRLAEEGWEVTIAGPSGGRLRMHGGGVATSSRAVRRWNHEGIDRHHLLDPRTGRPATTPVESATVLAGEAWWAEIVAKVLVIDPTVQTSNDIDRWNVQAVVFGPGSASGARRATTMNDPPFEPGPSTHQAKGE
ncbi:MAG: FAD:protein FMN transferase [Acidimicrobiales bacterium]|nr:FAD:protein FMN transferase [Acidimicrobiales bacterium]